MEKLSELSNPAWIVGQQEIADFMRGDEALLVRGYDPESTEPALRMYSQEYANALLAENMRVAHDLIARNGEIEGLKKRADELLAELEAKDQAHRVHAARLISERGVLRERVAELEAKLSEMTTFRDNAVKKNERRWEELLELRAKLATPVQLQNCDFESVAILAHWCTDEQLKAWVKGVEHAKKQIRAAGFTVEDKQ